MKANQHLGHEKTTPAEVRNGVLSVTDDVEIIAPSSVQPAAHECEAGSTEGLTLKKKILIVDDFIIKPVDKEAFRSRIKVLLKMKGEADRLMGCPQTSVYESIIDKQSGLYDPSYFTYQLDLEIKKSLRRKYSLTLIMIHVRLSEMNDGKSGPLATGEIMKQYGKLVKGCILSEDLATYFRDEEFVLALPYLERDKSVNIANRIHKAIINHNMFPQESSNSLTVTASFGIAFCPDDACTAEQLIQRAGAALGKAKRKGKDRICKWEDSSTAEC